MVRAAATALRGITLELGLSALAPYTANLLSSIHIDNQPPSFTNLGFNEWDTQSCQDLLQDFVTSTFVLSDHPLATNRDCCLRDRMKWKGGWGCIGIENQICRAEVLGRQWANEKAKLTESDMVPDVLSLLLGRGIIPRRVLQLLVYTAEA